MLALKRRTNESITMTLPDGRVIVVHVVEAFAGVTKLGVLAPTDVTIVRSELIGARR